MTGAESDGAERIFRLPDVMSTVPCEMGSGSMNGIPKYSVSE